MQLQVAGQWNRVMILQMCLQRAPSPSWVSTSFHGFLATFPKLQTVTVFSQTFLAQHLCISRALLSTSEL